MAVYNPLKILGKISPNSIWCGDPSGNCAYPGETSGLEGPLARNEEEFDTPNISQPYAPFGDPIHQVFLNQAYQHKVVMEQIDRQIDQRLRIHQNHIEDIRHRHMQMQEALSITRIINLPDRTRRESNLERALLDLEKNKRDEDLALWKDTLDLQTKLIEE